jgi:putative membrane protein
VTAISGLINFVVYFGTALALVGFYLAVYTLATAHNELALIRQNVVSASVALGLSLIGFSLPLASAIVYAQTVQSLAIWGAVAALVQVVVFYLVRLAVPRLSERIAADEMAAALFLGAASLAAGIINAASMSFG